MYSVSLCFTPNTILFGRSSESEDLFADGNGESWPVSPAAPDNPALAALMSRANEVARQGRDAEARAVARRVPASDRDSARGSPATGSSGTGGKPNSVGRSVSNKARLQDLMRGVVQHGTVRLFNTSPSSSKDSRGSRRRRAPASSPLPASSLGHSVHSRGDSLDDASISRSTLPPFPQEGLQPPSRREQLQRMNAAAGQKYSGPSVEPPGEMGASSSQAGGEEEHSDDSGPSPWSKRLIPRRLGSGRHGSIMEHEQAALHAQEPKRTAMLAAAGKKFRGIRDVMASKIPGRKTSESAAHSDEEDGDTHASDASDTIRAPASSQFMSDAMLERLKTMRQSGELSDAQLAMMFASPATATVPLRGPVAGTARSAASTGFSAALASSTAPAPLHPPSIAPAATDLRSVPSVSAHVPMSASTASSVGVPVASGPGVSPKSGLARPPSPADSTCASSAAAPDRSATPPSAADRAFGSGSGLQPGGSHGSALGLASPQRQARSATLSSMPGHRLARPSATSVPRGSPGVHTPGFAAGSEELAIAVAQAKAVAAQLAAKQQDVDTLLQRLHALEEDMEHVLAGNGRWETEFLPQRLAAAEAEWAATWQGEVESMVAARVDAHHRTVMSNLEDLQLAVSRAEQETISGLLMAAGWTLLAYLLAGANALVLRARVVLDPLVVVMVGLYHTASVQCCGRRAQRKSKRRDKRGRRRLASTAAAAAPRSSSSRRKPRPVSPLLASDGSSSAGRSSSSSSSSSLRSRSTASDSARSSSDSDSTASSTTSHNEQSSSDRSRRARSSRKREALRSAKSKLKTRKPSTHRGHRRHRSRGGSWDGSAGRRVAGSSSSGLRESSGFSARHTPPPSSSRTRMVYSPALPPITATESGAEEDSYASVALHSTGSSN